MDIMLVEDDVLFASIFEDFLKYGVFIDVNISTFTNGTQASEALLKRDFDLIITDANFPNGGAERIISEVTSKTPEIPIFVITGVAEPDVYLKLGAKEFFYKNDLDSVSKAIYEASAQSA